MSVTCTFVKSQCSYNLKALCHAIRAVTANEATHAHTVNEYWMWRMAGKFACRFKSACPVGRSTLQAAYLKPLLISITLWWSIVLKVTSSQLNFDKIFATVARSQSLRNPVNYTIILGVPILPVPTLIGFLK